MNKGIEAYELMELLLAGELSEQDQKKWEELCADQASLEQELDKHRLLNKLLEASYYAEIKETVSKIHEGKILKSNRFKRMFNRLGFGLGTILILFSIYTWNLNQTKELLQEPPSETGHMKPALKDTMNTQPIPEYVDIRTKNNTEVVEHPEIEEALEKTKKEDAPREPVEIRAIEHRTQTTLYAKKDSPPIESIKATSSAPDLNCKSFRYLGAVNAKASCSDQPTGQIWLDSLKIIGGRAPYQLLVSDIAAQFKYSATNLKPGNYGAYLIDSEQCRIFLGSAYISEVDCYGYKQHVFAPEKGEYWIIPNLEMSGILHIYSTKGQLVFSQQLEAMQEYKWDGKSDMYVDLPMGLYHYEIKFDESSTSVGSITIVR